jgi:flagellar biosynthesis protein
MSSNLSDKSNLPLTPVTKQAIAINYEQGSFAPRVVAKGKGLLAEEIIASAKRNDVFVHESRDLVNLLMKVDLDEHIPPQLYLAIAELLTWVYELENNPE